MLLAKSTIKPSKPKPPKPARVIPESLPPPVPEISEEDRLAKLLALFKEDFEFAAESLFQVKDEDGKIVPFIFNRAQKYLWEREKAARDQDKPFLAEVLKIRQLIGASTYFALRTLWLALFNPNTDHLTATHKDFLTAHLFGKQKFAYKCLPHWIKPKVMQDNRYMLHFGTKEGLGLESKIIPGTAQDQLLGTGFTFQSVHLSEFPKWHTVTDVKTVMTSLMQTITIKPHTSIIIEGTAFGPDFKDRWDEENGYEKIFISYVASEKARMKPLEGIKLSDNPNGRYGNELAETELIEKEIIKWYPEYSDNSIASTVSRENILMEILSWRRWCIDNKCNGDKEVFDQEYPITAERAFLFSGNSVFDQVVIDDIAHDLKENERYPIRYKFDESCYQPDKEWWKYALSEDAYGSVWIYEQPQGGGVYVLGADVSEGFIHSDGCSLRVYKMPEYKEVCAFDSTPYDKAEPPPKRIDSSQFADLIYAISMLFNNALIGCEVNGPGFSTVKRLTDKKVHKKLPNMYLREAFDRIAKKTESKWGWYTDRNRKEFMTSEFNSAMRSGDLLLNHMRTVKELRSYIRKTDGTMEGANKRPDNAVISSCICFQMTKCVKISRKSKPESSYGTVAYWKAMIDRESQVGQFGQRSYGSVNRF